MAHRRRREAYEAAGIDMFNGALENMSKEELARLAAREAKVANQRLRRLEAAGYGSTSTLSPAYKVVTTDISRWFPDKAKFSESVAVYGRMRIDTIKAILRDFDYYKTLKTATVSGTRQTIKERKKGFEDKTGLHFESDEQFARFWESGVGKHFFTMLGSKEAIRYLKGSKRDLDTIIREAQAWLAKDNGDKDNVDKIARFLGYRNLEDARRKTKPKTKKKGGKGGAKRKNKRK